MLTQSSFLDPGFRPVVPADPNLDAAERKRLAPHCHAILARLREGPASSIELIALTSHRYSGRIWDLREAGCVIGKRRLTPGTWEYRLDFEPAGL